MSERTRTAQLDGRLAVVTGAARGIGLGIAKRLGEAGATVAMTDVLSGEQEQSAAALRDAGLKVFAVPADVSSPDSVRDLFARIVSDHGEPEILVNNAGIIVPSPFLEHKLEDWNRVIQTNLTSIFLCCQATIPSMLKKGRGAIVNISSLGAFHYTVAHASYAASKAGIVAMTRELAYEFGPSGVRVNAIAPGAIETEMTRKSVAPEVTERLASSLRLGRWGRPEDVGDLVAFLVSDQASFLTGITVTIAGGADLKVLNG